MVRQWKTLGLGTRDEKTWKPLKTSIESSEKKQKTGEKIKGGAEENKRSLLGLCCCLNKLLPGFWRLSSCVKIDFQPSYEDNV